MPIRKSKQINLIPQDQFETSGIGRIIKWMLSTFRVIVIVTELLVMSAFLSRFWLDARNSDLNDEINAAKSQVTAFKRVEDEFRSIQKRISIAKSVYAENKSSTTVQNITKLLPEDVILSSISNIDGQVTIKASSFSERSIAQFLSNLESNKDFENIILSQVSSNFDNNAKTTFTVSLKVKKQATGGTN